MSIVNFTPLSALAGGALIGLAAALLALCCGRIAGISGIAGQLLTRMSADHVWRIAFLCGLFAAPWLLGLISEIGRQPQSEASPTLLLGAGLLVGFGTRLANGCTSGHGVCGLARFSLRSAIAVASFMAAGFLTVWLLRHVWGGA